MIGFEEIQTLSSKDLEELRLLIDVELAARAAAEIAAHLAQEKVATLPNGVTLTRVGDDVYVDLGDDDIMTDEEFLDLVGIDPDPKDNF